MPERNPLDGEPRRDPGDRRTVLVVDDNSTIRLIVRRILEDNGHTVFEAKDGLDGLEMFRRDPHRYHVVVMDIEMPRMNGIDAFWGMKAIRSDIPVIAGGVFVQTLRAQRIGWRRWPMCSALVSGGVHELGRHPRLV